MNLHKIAGVDLGACSYEQKLLTILRVHTV